MRVRDAELRPSEVTLRIARRRVEEQLGLEEGALDTRELKDAVKDAVEQAVVRVRPI